MLLPPRFLLPQVVSVLFLSSRVLMLISSPAVIAMSPEVVIFDAKFVKSFLALMVILPAWMVEIPSMVELMFPERLLALLAMVLVGRLLEI